MFGVILNTYINIFYLHEVVGGGSETQLFAGKGWSLADDTYTSMSLTSKQLLPVDWSIRSHAYAAVTDNLTKMSKQFWQ